MSIALHGTAGNAAVPSPEVWKDFPAQDAVTSPGDYVHIWEDFTSQFTANDVQNVGNGQWVVIGTNPDTAHVTDEANGVVNISGSGAGDDEAYLCSGMLCNEVIKKDSGLRLWFETRLKMDDTSADVIFICGLGEDALMTADAVPNDGATRNNITDYDFIGFHTDNDATNQGDMETCYHQDGDGGALTAVQATVRAFGTSTTYDDTYMKLGLRFDGKSTVTFYLDGAALGTTLDVDDLTGNKLDDALGIFIGIKDLAGGADDLKIDWIRYAHEKLPSGVV